MTDKKDKRIKLTPEQKDEIIEKHSSGVSAYRLAKDYGVTAMTIHYLIYPEKLKNNRKNMQSKEGYKESNRIRQAKFQAEKRAKKGV